MFTNSQTPEEIKKYKGSKMGKEELESKLKKGSASRIVDERQIPDKVLKCLG